MAPPASTPVANQPHPHTTGNPFRARFSMAWASMDTSQAHDRGTEGSLVLTMSDNLNVYRRAPGNYILICGGVRIPVRKVAMLKNSGYVRSMTSFLECATGDDCTKVRDAEIQLDNLDSVGLRTVAEFVETGNLCFDVGNVASTYKAADFLVISPLLESCKAYINYILITNCVDKLNISVDLQLLDGEARLERSRNFVCENFYRLPKTQYTKLSEDMLITFLSDNKPKVMSEASLVTVVKHWMEQNKGINWKVSKGEVNIDDDAQTTFVRLMNEIRWSLISPKEMASLDRVVMQVMDRVPQCWEMLRESRDYHSNLHTQPFKQNKRTRVRTRGSSLSYYTNDRSTDNINVHDLTNSQNYEIRDKSVPIPYTQRQRCYTQLITTENFMYAFGEKCYRYDPRFNNWLKLSDMVSTRHRDFSVVLCGQRFYVIGGNNTQTGRIGSVECFDIRTNRWSFVTNLPTHFVGQRACVVNDDIYISGGLNIAYDIGKHLYKYDTVMGKLGKWEKLPDMIEARYGHIMVAVGEFIYVIGGVPDIYESGLYFNTIERYCTESDQWTECTQTLEVMGGASYVSDGRIYIVGGRRGSADEPKDVKVFSEDVCRVRAAYTLENLGDESLYIYGCGLLDVPHSFWTNDAVAEVVTDNDIGHCVLL